VIEIKTIAIATKKVSCQEMSSSKIVKTAIVQAVITSPTKVESA